jgi:putative transcriptional regulator
MKDELFDELVASLTEGGKILRDEKAAERTFHFDRLDIKRIREKYNLTQEKFAALLGISVRTLRNWEQGRRTPEGPAKILLRIVDSIRRLFWTLFVHWISSRTDPLRIKKELYTPTLTASVFAMRVMRARIKNPIAPSRPNMPPPYHMATGAMLSLRKPPRIGPTPDAMGHPSP